MEKEAIEYGCIAPGRNISKVFFLKEGMEIKI